MEINGETAIAAPVDMTAARKLRLKGVLVRSGLIGLLALFLLFFANRIETLSYQNHVRDVRIASTLEMVEVRETIKTTLFEQIMELKQLAGALGQNPQMNQTEFNLKALDFLLAYPAIKNIAAAPDQIVSMVFPMAGNQAVIGMDYRDNAAQFPLVAKAIETGTGVVAGPVDLVQGGRGLILREPVMTKGPTGVPQSWGILSVVLDYDQFMAELGIPQFEENFDILIREVNSDVADSGNVLVGDLALLDSDPIVLDLTFPYGHWEIAATPDGGWPTHRPDYQKSWMLRFVMITFCMAALWYVLSLLDRRRLAESQLAMGIEALDHGFVMFDADRRLVAFNSKYKELAGGSGMVRIGARYEDIVKANLKKGLIPDAVGREKEWYDEWSKRIEIKAADKEHLLADGRTIRAYDRPMQDGSVVGLRIDITDLKKARVAAEAANKAKTDFMGVLSHELRTPLTVILGHAQLAKKMRSLPLYKKLEAEVENHPETAGDVMPKLDAMSSQMVKMMEALERSGNHLFTLISEILDFAKIDSGTLSMDMEDSNTDQIVAVVADQMRPMIEEKGLVFNADVASFPVFGDSKRLQQVLFNLIGNASKFTDEGAITVEVTQTADDVIFSVQDSGIGIPQDQLSRVFEAFHQVDSTCGRKYGGTGLGLAISRDIARAHGGDLSASSTPGQGCIFSLRLPRPKSKPTLMLAERQPKHAETEAPVEALVA